MSSGNRAVMCIIRRRFCDDGLCDILYLPSEPYETLVIYSLIPVFFLYMYCGYWWYCVFSLKCLPVVNLWQFRTWSKRYDGSNREALWTCTSHLTSHLKHQLLIHTIPKVLSALKPLTCVYVLSFLPEPLLLEWASNRGRWELLDSAGNVGLEDVSGWRRGQLMWWCPLEAWWIAFETLIIPVHPGLSPQWQSRSGFHGLP